MIVTISIHIVSFFSIRILSAFYLNPSNLKVSSCSKVSFVHENEKVGGFEDKTISQCQCKVPPWELLGTTSICFQTQSQFQYSRNLKLDWTFVFKSIWPSFDNLDSELPIAWMWRKLSCVVYKRWGRWRETKHAVNQSIIRRLNKSQSINHQQIKHKSINQSSED